MQRTCQTDIVLLVKDVNMTAIIVLIPLGGAMGYATVVTATKSCAENVCPSGMMGIPGAIVANAKWKRTAE